MPTAKIVYLGDLRCELTHVASNNTVVSDAPVDNHGKGQAFSPTDSCAAALGTCGLTIMGIYAEQHNIDIKGTSIEVTKHMGIGPRRIVKIDVIYTMPKNDFDTTTKKGLEEAALTCPVCFSLHPDITKNIVFNW